MAWSTRELAELASTTVNTIRHYHRLGLLAEPERSSNGYKQYRAGHLVRVLRIRRYRELGVPLTQIDSIDGPDSALQTLDEELVAAIEQLQRARERLAATLSEGAESDVPAGFGSVADRLPVPDRALLTIMAQYFNDDALEDIRAMIEVAQTDVDREYEQLPESSSDSERQDLAERMTVLLSRHLEDYPWLLNRESHITAAPDVVDSAVYPSVADLYRPAQLDVLERVVYLIHGHR
ncbi:MerR family transcriptional regulator [Rhodococcus sp. 14-2470-1b]|uniref:helix-turn-helix domain-containing protein n=1 Tax=unclassified Rhodococcus (in: high G+C Gram-positive bacteria) TaxID=192944 RepID=UPI000B9A411D|nr:MerR family transcriptional regulator [Rhodococcus sp. 14-2470-1b]OZF53164.1 MerR family transcriptional regulator [Rhodococcus sp. 14-2470-1b]